MRFTMNSAEQAADWHKAGVANGDTSIEDPPGMRQGLGGQIYLAYIRDPDGNKLVGVYRPPAGVIAAHEKDGPPLPGGPPEYQPFCSR